MRPADPYPVTRCLQSPLRPAAHLHLFPLPTHPVTLTPCRDQHLHFTIAPPHLCTSASPCCSRPSCSGVTPSSTSSRRCRLWRLSRRLKRSYGSNSHSGCSVGRDVDFQSLYSIQWENGQVQSSSRLAQDGTFVVDDWPDTGITHGRDTRCIVMLGAGGPAVQAGASSSHSGCVRGDHGCLQGSSIDCVCGRMRRPHRPSCADKGGLSQRGVHKVSRLQWRQHAIVHRGLHAPSSAPGTRHSRPLPDSPPNPPGTRGHAQPRALSSTNRHTQHQP